MMRAAALACGALICLAALPAGAAELRCAELTERTSTVMEEVPLMKDELATAVMWLRLDAAEAEQAGDPGLCVERMRTALSLLEGWRNGTAGREGTRAGSE